MKKLPGIAFDATGVIYRGTTPLPTAKQAFQTLVKHKIPFCVLTNAGSSLEQTRADKFNEYLGLPTCFSETNLVQANTPMKHIIANARQKPDEMAVVTGCLGIHNNVDRYLTLTGTTGFKFLTVEEMAILFPFLTPLTHKAQAFKEDRQSVIERVAPRFGQSASEFEINCNDILFSHKIRQVFVMSIIYNFESSL